MNFKYDSQGPTTPESVQFIHANDTCTFATCFGIQNYVQHCMIQIIHYRVIAPEYNEEEKVL